MTPKIFIDGEVVAYQRARDTKEVLPVAARQASLETCEELAVCDPEAERCVAIRRKVLKLCLRSVAEIARHEDWDAVLAGTLPHFDLDPEIVSFLYHVIEARFRARTK